MGFSDISNAINCISSFIFVAAVPASVLLQFGQAFWTQLSWPSTTIDDDTTSTHSSVHKLMLISSQTKLKIKKERNALKLLSNKSSESGKVLFGWPEKILGGNNGIVNREKRGWDGGLLENKFWRKCSA